MMRALIVDDEEPARARMRRLIGAYPDIEIIGEATNGLEALNQFSELSPDIIFLDIEMPELDGLEVARTIGGGALIVFVTAYDEFAIKAFETHAIDYLLKPVAEDRLRLAMEKIKTRHALAQNLEHLLSAAAAKRSSPRLGIKSGNRYVVVDLSRVSSILAQDHYSAIRIDGRELLSDEPLDAFERKLDPLVFLRVHRSAVINVAFVKELEREGDRKFVVILTDKSRVAVSRERLDEVRKRLKL